MRYGILLVIGALFLMAWFALGNKPSVMAANAQISPAQLSSSSHLKTAIFAAGCFWGVQERFERVHGVVSTEAGYTGGKLINPTYEEVCSHDTGHAEAVQVTYDPAKVSFAELLDTFWSIHDPTTLDSQGPDFGDNYRSAIFCVDADQEKIAKQSLAEVSALGVFPGKIVTQIVPASKFYNAEDYHQHYFDIHGGTCHNGVAIVHTRLAAAAKKEREAAAATQPAGT